MRDNEEGSALVMSLLIVIALSVIGAALTVLSLSETYGSMNYRLMSQARYAAESGVHKAANFLLNSYVVPGGAGDPLASYDTTTWPVSANGAAVALSALTSVTSNYPAASVGAAFAAAATGSLVTGNANLQYAAAARLLSMRQILVYGVVAPVVIQTWELTGEGTTTGARKADVQVTATLEREKLSLFNFAVFATAPNCGALKFGGGAVVDSYDSQNIVWAGGKPVTQPYDGNVGSNGNLNESGTGTTIDGTMSTPRTGVGNCANGSVDAWTDNGHATVTAGLVALPQTLTYPTPDPPNPMPPTTNLGLDKNSTCAGIAGCTVAPAAPPILAGLVLPPGTYGDVTLSAQAAIHLTAGVYTINSWSMVGNANLVIDSGPVVLNVGGQGQSTPIDFSGGTVTNGGLNPAMFQVQYAGTGTIKLTGNSGTSGAVYAPNAAVQFAGGSDWYGAVVANTVNDTGGTAIHNDRQLSNNLFTVGNYMLSSFSWKKY